MAKTHFFIDLEGTVVAPMIDHGLANAHLLNPSFVQGHIQRVNPDEIIIFSYALYTPHDLLVFEQFLKPNLEKVFKLPVSAPYCLEDFCRAGEVCGGFEEGSLRLATLRAFRGGKRGGFVDFIEYNYRAEGDLFILIDDEVKDEVLFQNGRNFEFIAASCVED